LGVRVIQLLEWWSIPRRGWIIILAELAVIISLGGWVYSEYLNDIYFQSYVNSLSPILVPIVSVGFGITSATIATLLYFSMRSIKRNEGSQEEQLSTKRGSTKRIVKKSQVPPSRSERATVGGSSTTPKPKVLVAGSGARRGTAHGNDAGEDESD